MTPAIRDALLSVDISHFTDYDPTPFYHDRPLVFAETDNGGVKTISAPHMICTLLHHLELSEKDEVLLLGAKGGYLAALVGHIVGPEGRVTVVDPNRQVIDHVRERITSWAGEASFITRKMRQINHTPPNLPQPLNRALVTGSLDELPNWLIERVVEGGFIIAPIGARVSQRLVKRELQGNWFDTDLGGVLFGPVDISETETEADSIELAGLLEDALEVGEELGIFEWADANRLRQFAHQLRDLPTDLPPILLTDESDDPWEEEEEGEDFIMQYFDHDIENLENHPLFRLLDGASEWLMPLWPTVLALLETRMQHPGAPDANIDDLGFGNHEDLVP